MELEDETGQRDIAGQAANGSLTRKAATNGVRQRRGKQIAQSRRVRLTFPAENGIRVSVTASRKGAYYEVEEALVQALEEVRHRIANRVQLF